METVNIAVYARVNSPEQVGGKMNREKKKALNEESIRMMHRIFDAEMIGYAYLYPNDGGARQESVLATTPENLANYVGSHFLDAEKMVITDMCDRLILDTYGGFINQCPDQNLCREINQHLVPIQMGDKEAGEILIVSRDAAEAYFAMEDEAVCMAECRMM